MRTHWVVFTVALIVSCHCQGVEADARGTYEKRTYAAALLAEVVYARENLSISRNIALEKINKVVRHIEQYRKHYEEAEEIHEMHGNTAEYDRQVTAMVRAAGNAHREMLKLLNSEEREEATERQRLVESTISSLFVVLKIAFEEADRLERYGQHEHGKRLTKPLVTLWEDVMSHENKPTTTEYWEQIADSVQYHRKDMQKNVRRR